MEGVEDEEKKRQKIFDVFGGIWSIYESISVIYFQKLQQYCYVKDGLAGYTSENALFSVVVFQQIGILASIGLAQIFNHISSDDNKKVAYENALVVADALCNLIENNPVSSSPRLDKNSLEITLALLLL